MINVISGYVQMDQGQGIQLSIISLTNTNININPKNWDNSLFRKKWRKSDLTYEYPSSYAIGSSWPTNSNIKRTQWGQIHKKAKFHEIMKKDFFFWKITKRSKNISWNGWGKMIEFQFFLNIRPQKLIEIIHLVLTLLRNVKTNAENFIQI